jgi:hypothetical protein
MLQEMIEGCENVRGKAGCDMVTKELALLVIKDCKRVILEIQMEQGGLHEQH